MKLEMELEFFLKISSFEKLPVFVFIPSKVSLSFNVFSLFPPIININNSSPPKESCTNKFSNTEIENYFSKIEP